MLFILLGLGFASCADEDPAIYPVDNLTDTAEEFEMLLLAATNTSLVIEKLQDGEVKSMGAIVAFAGAPKSGGVTYSYEVTENTMPEGALQSGGSGELSSGSTTSIMPIMIDLDQVEIGVPYTVSLKLTDSAAPLTDASVVTYSVTVVCPSDLAGEYSATTTGQSTDGCCPDPVTVTSDVTISGSSGAYTIPDFSASLYFAWYAVYGITEGMGTDGTLELSFGDVCGQLSGTMNEPFDTEVVMTGSVDPSTGVITYTWVNGYDDTATVTLTPK